MSDLHKLDNTELLLKALELEAENADLRDGEGKNTDMILKQAEKIEEFELQRVELKKAVKDLSLYLQVEAG